MCVVEMGLTIRHPTDRPGNPWRALRDDSPELEAADTNATGGRTIAFCEIEKTLRTASFVVFSGVSFRPFLLVLFSSIVAFGGRPVRCKISFSAPFVSFVYFVVPLLYEICSKGRKGTGFDCREITRTGWRE